MTAGLIYSATMSLDGYIAGPGGDMSWLDGPLYPADVELADGLARRVGCLLVGNRSYRGDDPNRGTDAEGAFSGQYNGPTVVLTHHPAAAESGVEFVGDLHAAIALARRAAGDADYVNIIGADVARQCLAAGELDEILLFVAPILLGGGTRAFPGDELGRIRLTRLPGVAAHWYRVRYTA